MGKSFSLQYYCVSAFIHSNDVTDGQGKFKGHTGKNHIRQSLSREYCFCLGMCCVCLWLFDRSSCNVSRNCDVTLRHGDVTAIFRTSTPTSNNCLFPTILTPTGGTDTCPAQPRPQCFAIIAGTRLAVRRCCLL